MPQPCNLDGISMNIQEENSAHYFRVQSEREQTFSSNLLYVTGFGKTGLIAGLVKIDFFAEKASTKFKYCLRKI